MFGRSSGFRFARLVVSCFAISLGAGCGAANERPARVPIAEVRENARASSDGNVVANWLIAELVQPGGSAKGSAEARARLDKVAARGLMPSFARAFDDSMHGRLKRVSDEYLEVVRYARDSDDPRAPLLAWIAAHEATGFRHAAPGLWKRWKPQIEGLLKAPGRIGWRARIELAEWWGVEANAEAVENSERLTAELHGCVLPLRLAGTFGRNTPHDALTPFAPERGGIWPERWPLEPDMGDPPHVLETTTEGCSVSADEPVRDGIAYAETFIDVDQPSEVIIAAESAFALWVDDHLVLRRDVGEWGSWLRYGVLVELGHGRHRIVAKLGTASTSLRVLNPDGTPYGKRGSLDASRPYVLEKPRRVRSANLLETWVRNGNVVDPNDDLVRLVASRLASLDDQADVASILIEPLVKDPEHATGPALAVAADFAESDPIFADGQRRDLVRELMERAAQKDPGLWAARLTIAATRAERTGPIEAAREIAELVDAFPEVPAVLSQLSGLYGQLGWRPELSRTVRELARRFPDDPSALAQAVAVFDGEGESKKSDELVERIKKLDPDSEMGLVRALSRADYATALEELKRLGKRRPDRKDIVERVSDVMVRAGNESETWKKLEAAIEKDEKEEEPRLALADAYLASNKGDALVKAIVEATQAGAPTDRLESALSLVEGATELEPFRMNSEKVIAEYEGSGTALEGTAARVLDYSAVWVKSDGSSRLLDHQIIRVQSAEAITEMAEQPLRGGMFLKLRVVKKDGRTLEPEVVGGKPTVTMPHLEIGDYIETERIESTPSDGEHGARYLGPRWFFREENIAYARSEFVVISPPERPLQIETRNEVPPPVVSDMNGLIVRRWRVDKSPAAPVEPFSAPIVEFLPSVQVGWGVSSDSTLRAMTNAVDERTPVDPRIARIARRIVEGAKKDERVRRLYRWIVSNVEEGEESDGRRVIIGKNGNLWRGFITLCRALDIPVDYAVVQNRLTLPPQGPFSESMVYTQPLLRVRSGQTSTWLTLGSKHAPFGYVPAETRGMPAVVLFGDGWEKTTTPAGGALDDAATEGTARLADDGSAELDLVQSFHGKYATGLRGALSQLPTRQIRDAIETRLLGGALRGVELVNHRVEGLDDPDAPIRIVTKSRARAFAQPVGKTLVVQPPFVPRLGQYATLPARQTPLLIADSLSQRVKLTIKLPPGATLETRVGPAEVRDGERAVVIADSHAGQAITLERRVSIPAGRVQTKDYAKFLDFTRQADEAISGSVRIRVR
jgi:tetratricopeptide (TPR) repeat protein